MQKARKQYAITYRDSQNDSLANRILHLYTQSDLFMIFVSICYFTFVL